MLDKIGKIAGEVWKYLNENEEATIYRLKEDLDESTKNISMAIGWLAREGKLDCRQEGRAFYISLKKNN